MLHIIANSNIIQFVFFAMIIFLHPLLKACFLTFHALHFKAINCEKFQMLFRFSRLENRTICHGCDTLWYLMWSSPASIKLMHARMHVIGCFPALSKRCQGGKHDRAHSPLHSRLAQNIVIPVMTLLLKALESNVWMHTEIHLACIKIINLEAKAQNYPKN